MAGPLQSAAPEVPAQAAAAVSDEEIDKRVASLPESQRDRMVGAWIRAQGGGELDNYNRMLSGVVTENTKKLLVTDFQNIGIDKFVPRIANSSVWKCCFLRKSTGGEVWYCNACCPNVGDRPLGGPSCQKYFDSPKKLEAHLATHQSIISNQLLGHLCRTLALIHHQV